MGVFSTPEPDPKKEKNPEDTPADKMGALAHILTEDTTQQPLYPKANALGVVNSEGDKSDKYDKNGEAEQRAEPQQHGARVLYAKQIRATAGILCTGEAHGNACIKEAEWNLNGNLYCPEHFLASKKTCEDNGYAVREAS